MTSDPHPYRGRFAPSPTGPLHFGSLIAAVASYLQARACGGEWLLRIEDIDPPREPPGADKLILDAMEAYRFEWDGPVVYQSTFTPHHESLVDRLLSEDKAYPCSCSRRDLADAHGNRPIRPGPHVTTDWQRQIDGLLDLARAGDSEGFTGLYRQMGGTVAAFCRSRGQLLVTGQLALVHIASADLSHLERQRRRSFGSLPVLPVEDPEQVIIQQDGHVSADFA